jgi:photosystem II stability/assembly factor-like uncharacterized protein
MRSLFLLCYTLICFTICFAQTPDKALLKFQSYGGKLFVNKNEQLVIGTRVGEVAFASSINDYWQMSSPVKNDSNGLSFGTLIDNINFFNNDTGFAAGFISGKNDKYNILFHTTNKGKTWSKLNFGQDGWVDDAVNLDNGEAWMSVSGSGIAYTNDYGFTWQAFNIPEKKQRFTTIYFNTKREGIIGSLGNMIAVTTDNCKTWKLLQTPLDQKKYSKTYKEHRPEINVVAIYKNYYIVSQEGIVFYSKKDSINWIWLPGYSNFYTDAENSALYFKKDKNGFVRVNDQLQPVHFFDSNISSGNGMCRNGSLFVKNDTEISQFKSDNSTVSNYIYTNDTAEIKPSTIGYSRNAIYGLLGNTIYTQRTFNGKWVYEFELPFIVDSGFVSITDNNTILVSKTNDSLFYYNIDLKQTQIKNRKTVLHEFCQSKLKSIIFEKGSRGCFHNHADILVYNNEGGVFELSDAPEEYKKGKTLPQNNETINELLVNNFVKQIPAMLYKQTTINDLGFTENDYDNCKKDIIKFKAFAESNIKKNISPFDFNVNNIDFNRLVALVDSIKTIDPNLLDRFLYNLSDMWSTTTNWTGITLVNEKGQMMKIQCSYYEPNAFYFPWQVSLEGFNYSSTNIEINKFIKAVYPNFIDDKNKVAVLHRIVKNLY